MNLTHVWYSSSDLIYAARIKSRLTDDLVVFYICIFEHILTLTGGVSTMRRIAGSANTALGCTTCRPIHVVCMHAV